MAFALKEGTIAPPNIRPKVRKTPMIFFVTLNLLLFLITLTILLYFPIFTIFYNKSQIFSTKGYISENPMEDLIILKREKEFLVFEGFVGDHNKITLSRKFEKGL